MKKLFNADILDLFTTENGLVYACKDIVGQEQNEVVAFFEYDIAADKFKKIPVNTYIERKYGEDNYTVARALGDFVTCRILPWTSALCLASYANGKIKVFDLNGNIEDTCDVSYNGSPACSPVLRDEGLWMAVPDENALINFSVEHRRVEMRVGGKTENAFLSPCDVYEHDNLLYISNANSFSIKTFNPETFSVNSFCTFKEPVYKYFRMKKNEYVLLKSGVYEI
ncbi:MAG: hypothetical protein K6F64_01355 [Clostridia bacterium]|nr:hypothetical protein [Clostridia bacterium]